MITLLIDSLHHLIFSFLECSVDRMIMRRQKLLLILRSFRCGVQYKILSYFSFSNLLSTGEISATVISRLCERRMSYICIVARHLSVYQPTAQKLVELEYLDQVQGRAECSVNLLRYSKL